jgi:uncharacterized membrane protein
VSKARLETFSDGVFAIAATLLILNVRAPRGDLAHGLRHIWPSYAGYAVSFLTIGIMWVNHHSVFAQIESVDRTFLCINVLFLMVVAFVPFPTELVTGHIRDDGALAACLAYGFTLTIMAVLYSTVWFYAAGRRRLLREDADPRVVRGITRSYLPGPFIYLAATLVSFASPVASVVLFAAIALFYVAESSIFGGRSPSSAPGGPEPLE